MARAPEMPAVGRWNWWRSALYWIGGSLGRAIFFPGRLTVTGVERIPTECAFLLAANHTSTSTRR